MMKKQDVISLTKAGVSDSLIITMLATSHSWFQLKTQDVLDLKNAGVSESVINAMIVSNEPPAEGDRYVQDGNYYYPPYYWYPGYYPYWCPRSALRRLRIPRRMGRRHAPSLMHRLVLSKSCTGPFSTFWNSGRCNDKSFIG
jgi:hypothetical protein